MLGFVTRFASITLVVLAIGCASFAMLARNVVGDGARTATLFARVGRTGMYAAMGLIVVAFVRLYVQLDGMRFPGEPLSTSFTPLMTTTTWGKAWGAQIVFAGITALAFGASIRARSAVALTSVSLTIVAVTFALSGHAVAAEKFRAGMISADTLHVISAGMWIGTLAVILLSWPSLRDLHAVAPMINAFTPLALSSAAMLTLSGVIGAVSHVGLSVSTVASTTYGRILSAKVFCVALVILAGWFNWKRNSVRINNDDGASLRTGATRELLAAVAVLVVTAVLIASPLPGE